MAEPELPTPVAPSLDITFELQIDRMVDLGQVVEQSYMLCGQRVWMLPDLNGWDGNLFDVEDIRQAFDRTALNDQYIAMLTDRGVVSDGIAIRAQLDQLSAMERSFRQRHTGPLRSAMHAASRRRGHGHGNGLFNDKIKTYINKVIEAGAVPAPSTP